MAQSHNVLQVLPRLNSGGVERGTVDLTCYLNSQVKWHCHIVSEGGSLEIETKRKKISLIYLPLASKNPLTIILNIFRLSKIIKNYNINLIHARSRAPAWSAYFAAKINHIPFITTVHGAYAGISRLKKLYNSIMVKGHKVIAVSKFIAAYIQQNYHVDRSKIEIISRGVDLTSFDSSLVSDARIESLLSKYKLPFDKKIILLPGRFTRIKGHMVLLDALALLNSSDWICLMVGSISSQKQEYMQDIFNHASQLKIRHKLYVFNECNDMPALYKMSQLIICPTTVPESFGRVIAEAMVMEKPVIATDHGGAQEIIEHNVNGFLVPPNNPKSLAAVIKKVLNFSPDELRRLTLLGHRHIYTNFDNATMLKKTFKVYKSLLQ